MLSSQRPRPRARKASSIAVVLSPSDSLTSTIKSTTSPPTSAVFKDDDDDFFTRKRKVPSKGRTRSAPKIELNNVDEIEEETDFEEELAGSSSDGEGNRRKRTRRQMPSWTKSTSFNKVESVARDASSTPDKGPEENNVLSHDSRFTRRNRASRSPSLTPPPELDPHVLQHIRSVLEQHAPKSMEMLDDDESFNTDIGGTLDLDPDLVRMIRGDRAREQRKAAKEREARQRLEEERMRRLQPVQKAQPEMNVIEVEDSDEDEPKKRSNNSRDRISSSPVEIVSFSQLNRQEAPVKEASPKPIVDEDVRLSITMKGGDGGSLQAMVRVRPTTQIKKLLDHFKESHKDAIPKAKLRFVKIRFDGELLDPAATIGDAGIEDEEQIDVVW